MKIVRMYILFVFSVVLMGCSGSEVSKVSLENLKIFPAPPEPTRIQYLTSFSSSKDILGEQSGFVDYVAGEEEEGGIIKPYGISIYKGKIYICDTILGGLEIIDLNEESFEYLQPKGLAQFKKPINCIKDSTGLLYVVDAERSQILVFDDNEKYLKAFGEDDLIRPTDIFIYKDEIFVTDLKGHNIKVFSVESYDLIRTLPSSQLPASDGLFSPTNIFVKNDRVYVSDVGDSKVKWYTIEGTLIDSVGSFGRGMGQLVRPKGIAVDDELNLYVVDAAFENIQIFNKEGQLLMFFGGTYEGPGDMWLPAKVIIDYDNLDYFKQYVYEGFDLKYLIFVTNQYGPDKISVYGFVEQK